MGRALKAWTFLTCYCLAGHARTDRIWQRVPAGIGRAPVGDSGEARAAFDCLDVLEGYGGWGYALNMIGGLRTTRWRGEGHGRDRVRDRARELACQKCGHH